MRAIALSGRAMACMSKQPLRAAFLLIGLPSGITLLVIARPRHYPGISGFPMTISFFPSFMRLSHRPPTKDSALHVSLESSFSKHGGKIQSSRQDTT
jgi:hypothetical protein